MGWWLNHGKSAKVNADYAKIQGDIAKQEANKVEQFIEENKTRWLPAVATVDLRNSTYPNPQNGDTVKVTGEAKTYRYQSNTGWVVTDIYDATAIERLTTQLAQKADKTEVNTLATNKVDKVDGKQLSTNDFTNADKNLVQQIPQLARQDFVDAQLTSIVSGAPKATYATLQALKDAYPEGTDGTFLVLSDGHWYYWNEIEEDWLDGGLYQAQGIADGSVSVNKTSFAKTGKNLFIPETASFGEILVPNGLNAPLSGYLTTDYIPVKTGISYAISNPRNYALYNSDKVIYDWNSDEVNKNSPKIFTPSQNGYLRTSFMYQYLSTFQIEEGNVVTEYEPPIVTIPQLKLTEPQIEEIVENLPKTGDLTIYKVGNSTKIRSKFDDANDIVVSSSIYTTANKLFNFDGSYLYSKNAIDEDIQSNSGENIHPTSDDIAPIRTFYTVGANHGYFLVEITASGKTSEDIGSVWSDGVNQWIIADVVSNRISVLPDYQVVDGITSPVSQAHPFANLTHVSGANNTSDISISTKSTKQLYPSIKNISRKFEIDGTEIGEGKHIGDVLNVHESYEILDYKSLIDKIKANIGIRFETFINQIESAVKMSIIYEFKKGGKCTIYHSFIPFKKLNVQNIQLLQSNILAYTGHTTYQYMPNVLPKGGYDFKQLVDMTNYSSNLIFGVSDYIDSNIPPHRYVQWLQNGTTKKIGFTMGYLPDKADGANEKRKLKSPNAWDLRNSKKNYPLMMNPRTLEVGERYSVVGYRNYIPPINATNYSEIDVGNEVYIFVDYHRNVNFESLPLLKHVGKNVEVVEKSTSTTIYNEIVDADGVLISVTGSYGYAILKLT